MTAATMAAVFASATHAVAGSIVTVSAISMSAKRIPA
jgi:hypothetical protein